IPTLADAGCKARIAPLVEILGVGVDFSQVFGAANDPSALSARKHIRSPENRRPFVKPGNDVRIGIDRRRRPRCERKRHRKIGGDIVRKLAHASAASREYPADRMLSINAGAWPVTAVSAV